MSEQVPLRPYLHLFRKRTYVVKMHRLLWVRCYPINHIDALTATQNTDSTKKNHLILTSSFTGLLMKKQK